MMLSSLFLALHKFVEERMMMMVAITHCMIVKNAYRNEEKRKKGMLSKQEGKSVWNLGCILIVSACFRFTRI